MESETILLVEDNVELRALMREAIEAEGHRVHEAGDGAEALEYLARDRPPCLIVLDLILPVLSGFEFMKGVGENPFLRAIPVLVVSALERTRLEEAVSQWGAVGYLAKPFHLDDLLGIVARHCRRGT